MNSDIQHKTEQERKVTAFDIGFKALMAGGMLLIALQTQYGTDSVTGPKNQYHKQMNNAQTLGRLQQANLAYLRKIEVLNHRLHRFSKELRNLQKDIATQVDLRSHSSNISNAIAVPRAKMREKRAVIQNMSSLDSAFIGRSTQFRIHRELTTLVPTWASRDNPGVDNEFQEQ